ncbi:hypothetical protein BBD42_05770 [Paenibacillus sp. BIHB 4019]|uniref:DUF4179 domain-containing protein n=1 Tax=Paenibacillus sp. BIHB 4019 TaxID=1870819 RepID=A0A1B2DE98_9BACL|nr:DUF4179 domain-containing protein [Paenibacillus sp. BIHB 4019]ANY66020.1 hypothetical protein BBD42_05770 [Paenibacillus sp. BIHB 4019]
MTFWNRTKAETADLKAGTGAATPTLAPAPTPEDKKIESVLFEDRLQDDFTDRVMLELEGIDIEAAGNSDPDPLDLEPGVSSIAQQVKRQHAARKSLRRKAWGLAAAAVVLAGSTLLYAQPTLADMVRSLFAQNSYVDNGMKQAQEAGLVQHSDASAENQGYTLKVNEVIADSTRLIVGIDIYDAKGNPVAGEIQSTNGNFVLFDVDRGHIGDIPYGIMTGGNTTTSRFEFVFRRPVLKDKLQFDAYINQIALHQGTPGADGFSSKTVKGQWTLRVDVDLSKAKAQTLLTPIGISYETPSGIRIQMQGATRTPSGGSLEFTTSLTPEAASRALNGQSGFNLLNYHLEDEQGNVLEKSPSMTEMEFSSRRYEFDRWSGLTKWFYQFDDFAYDKQQIRFVLDSYMIREKGEAAVIFDPSQASAENPVLFEDAGDSLLLKGLTVNSDGVGKIQIGGTFSNPNFASDTWIAVDENGKEYRMSVGGGYSEQNPNLDDGADLGFVMFGMNSMPKELTIKRTVINRQYKDADLSFIIPSTGMIGVIPQ